MVWIYLKRYYWAAQQLTQVKQWFSPSLSSWKRLESFDILQYELKYLSYFGLQERKKITNSPVILNSIQVWKATNKWQGNNASLSPFSPKWGNLCFSSCFNDDTITILAQQRFKGNVPPLPGWYYYERHSEFHLTICFNVFKSEVLVQSRQGSLVESKASKRDVLLNNSKTNCQLYFWSLWC